MSFQLSMRYKHFYNELRTQWLVIAGTLRGMSRPVQLMITVTTEPAGTQVRIDGWLDGDGVAELARTLASVPGPVRLLLHDLRGADAGGPVPAAPTGREGTALDGLSPYLRLMLARSRRAPDLRVALASLVRKHLSGATNT